MKTHTVQYSLIHCTVQYSTPTVLYYIKYVYFPMYVLYVREVEEQIIILCTIVCVGNTVVNLYSTALVVQSFKQYHRLVVV